MTVASVRKAAEEAAKKGSLTPHQLAAFGWLDENLTAKQKEEFTALWRAAGSPAAPERPKVAECVALALPLIKEFEGCKLAAYPDPGTGGEPWTIGWGTTKYFDGTKVKKGDKITQAQADEYLQNWVENDAALLRKRIPAWGELSVKQQAALLSFTYNAGSNWFGADGYRTITDRIKRKAWSEVPEALMLYVNPGSDVEEGLKSRRKAEGEMFGGGAALSPASPFNQLLTPHIRLGEFALDQEARRFKHQHQIDTAFVLATFLERVRRNFDGQPIIITSGYRPPEINRAVGGASASEHLYDAPGVGAVDFYVKGSDINTVQAFCDHYWPYSVGYGAPKGFVHLGIRAGSPRVRWDY